MTHGDPETAKLMKDGVVALMTVVEDVEAGTYPQKYRNSLADAMEILARALRNGPTPVIDLSEESHRAP